MGRCDGVAIKHGDDNGGSSYLAILMVGYGVVFH